LLAAVAIVDGDLVITSTGAGTADDDLTLAFSSGSLVLGDANETISLGPSVVGTGDGSPSVTIDPAANAAFTGAIVFQTGNDTLTVDSSAGSFPTLSLSKGLAPSA